MADYKEDLDIQFIKIVAVAVLLTIGVMMFILSSKEKVANAEETPPERYRISCMGNYTRSDTYEIVDGIVYVPNSQSYTTRCENFIIEESHFYKKYQAEKAND